MKKLFSRILAFVLDFILVSCIILGISMISIFNPNSSELNKKYREFYKVSRVYTELTRAVDLYFEDNVITTEEMEEIKVLFSDYTECFSNIQENEEQAAKVVSELKESIEKQNVALSNALIVSINKLNTPQTIISLIVYVAYFGVLQCILGGQTPFKRLFRLKVVNNGDSKKKVSLISYLIRSVLVSEIIISIIDMILVMNLKSDSYITVNYYLTQIKYLYEMAFLVCMVIRDDSRSLHDLLLNTRVLKYDQNGREIIDPLFSDKNEELSNKAN